MSNISIPTWMDARIQPAKFTRNGRPVSTSVETFARRLANQIRAFEGKELFSAFGKTPPIDSYTGGTSRVRWRFRQKTSPHVTRICIVMRMALQNGNLGGSPVPEDASVRFELLNAANAVIGTFEHHYGGTLTTLKADDTPDTWALVTGYIDVTAGTEVHGRFTEYKTGRLISALVYEVGPDHDTDNGYLFPNVTQGAEVYADDRERLTEIVNDTWIGGAAVVENINCKDDGGAFSLLGSTPMNVIDSSSTTVSAATPGFYFDGTGKALDGAAGVMVQMWVYASTTDEAYVELKNSAGAVVGNVTFTGGTAGWHSSGPFALPASAAKYDVHAYSTSSETINLYAVSLYEVG